MLKWFVEKYLKQYIDELVEQRFNNKMYEKYYEGKQQDLKQRIQKVRASLDDKIPISAQAAKTKVLSSSRVHSRSAKPRIQEPPSQASIEKATKAAELDAMRAKLMGKKT